MSTQRYAFDRYVEVHKNPAGPGDTRPTELQIVQDNDLEGKLTEKVMLITGANSSIGAETAKALAATGASLFLGVRSLDKGERLIADIEATHPVAHGRLELVCMDMLSLASIRSAARDIISKTDRLNVVINNAGVALTPKSTTPDGFDNMFQSSSPGLESRVVNVSSITHRYGSVDFEDMNWTRRQYDPLGAYASSKTATSWMANEIERRYTASGLHGISLHPGAALATNSNSFYDPDYLAQMDQYLTLPGLSDQFKSNKQGAATSVVAAIDKELEGKGGIYLENCGTAVAFNRETDGPTDHGYETWCFDGAGARRLWEESCKLLKMDRD